mgnify:CR=1 FL=1
MNNKNDPKEVLKNLNAQVPQAKHGLNYYFSFFLLVFAIPLFVILEFIYPAAGGWTVFDLVFVLILLALAAYGLYKEFQNTKKVPIWLSVIGVISGIVITIVAVFINMLR